MSTKIQSKPNRKKWMLILNCFVASLFILLVDISKFTTDEPEVVLVLISYTVWSYILLSMIDICDYSWFDSKVARLTFLSYILQVVFFTLYAYSCMMGQYVIHKFVLIITAIALLFVNIKRKNDYSVNLEKQKINLEEELLKYINKRNRNNLGIVMLCCMVNVIIFCCSPILVNMLININTSDKILFMILLLISLIYSIASLYSSQLFSINVYTKFIIVFFSFIGLMSLHLGDGSFNILMILGYFLFMLPGLANNVRVFNSYEMETI